MNSKSQEIKKEINKKYPKLKVRVTKRHHDTYDVSYVDGISTDLIREIVDKLEYGKFDGMTDSYDYNNSAGIAKYIFVDRSYSKEFLKNIANKYFELWGEIPEAKKELVEIVEYADKTAHFAYLGIEPWIENHNAYLLNDIYRFIHSEDKEKTK